MSKQKEHGISWTDTTWNVVTGCTPVSVGCQNCYAARYAQRGIGDFIRKHYDPCYSSRPFDNVRNKVFDTMALCRSHTFQLLTKRPKRMLGLLGHSKIHIASGAYPLPNVWLGVSCENQAAADERIPLLLQTPAKVRFVSGEPLLGPVDLEKVPLPDAYFQWAGVTGCLQPLSEKHSEPDCYRYFQRKALKLDWVIAGAESGPKRRCAELDWFRSLRDQCVAAGVPFHLKQMEVDGKLVKEPELDGRKWLGFPGERS